MKAESANQPIPTPLARLVVEVEASRQRTRGRASLVIVTFAFLDARTTPRRAEES